MLCGCEQTFTRVLHNDDKSRFKRPEEREEEEEASVGFVAGHFISTKICELREQQWIKTVVQIIHIYFSQLNTRYDTSERKKNELNKENHQG